MNNYKVTCDYNGFEFTADDAIELAGFDEEWYSKQKVILIGNSVYSEPQLICSETM